MPLGDVSKTGSVLIEFSRTVTKNAPGDATPPHEDSGGSPQIGGVVLLAGGLKPPELVEATGGSILDLHVAADVSLLDLWLRRIRPLCGNGGEDHGTEAEWLKVPVRILCGSSTPLATAPVPVPGWTDLSIERDAGDYRGPAGAVQDAFEAMGRPGTLLVGEANLCVGVDLGPLLASHAESRASVTIGVNKDRTPSGIYLVEPRALELVPRAGFMDMKEQWLSRVKVDGLSVRVQTLPDLGTMPIRALGDLLSAMREMRRTKQQDPDALELSDEGPVFGERATVHRSVISADVGIHSDTLIVDSIVMPGATIERGATVVRSLVSRGAVIQEGAQILDGIARSGERGTVVTTTQRRQRWGVLR